MTRYGMAIDMDHCTGCQTCVVSCQMNHALRPGFARTRTDALEWGRWPDGDAAFLSHGCLHCDEPLCVRVCPTGASAKRSDGIVTIDAQLCIGCGVCVTACAYGARTLCMEDGFHFGAQKPAPYEELDAQPVGVADKCSFCVERVDAGEQPACVRDCVAGVRVFGDMDDPASDVSAFLAQNDCASVPGTSVFYRCGSRDLNLEELITHTSFTSAKDDRESQEPPHGEFNPAVVGAAVVGAAAIGTGLGVSAKRSRAKRNGA